MTRIKPITQRAAAAPLTPGPKDQYNFTDPESRIMKMGGARPRIGGAHRRRLCHRGGRGAHRAGRLWGATDLRVLTAVTRDEAHGRTGAQLERKQDRPTPPPAGSFPDVIAHRVATRNARAHYKLRQQTIRTVFDIIKQALGFRRFSLRGQATVSLEWTLVTLAYNFKRHLGATFRTA